MVGYPQMPELLVPAGILRGHAELMSRDDTYAHTRITPSGLPLAPHSWPYIAVRDGPVAPRAARTGRSSPPWPRRSPEPPSAAARARGVPRGNAGRLGRGAGTWHGHGPLSERRPWCAEHHRTPAADRLVAAPTPTVADPTGDGPQPRTCAAGSSTPARSAIPRFLPYRTRAHQRGGSAMTSARARSRATVSVRNRLVRNAAPAGTRAGGHVTAQVLGPVAAETVTAGPGDIERRARRYERRMAHRPFPPAERDNVPVLFDAAGSQRTAPGRRSPTVRPDDTPLPVGTPSRIAPDRRFRRAPIRNPIRRDVPEDHTGARNGPIRARSVAAPRNEAGGGSRRYPVVQRHSIMATPVGQRPDGGEPRIGQVVRRTQGRLGRRDLPHRGHAVGCRDGGGERAGRAAARSMTVGGRQLVTYSVSTRARHRRPAVERRRWDVLLGAAFTTVLVAFPLGPGATAAAYSGESVVLAQPYTGDTVTGFGPAGAPGPNSRTRASAVDGAPPRPAQIMDPAVADADHFGVGVPGPLAVAPGKTAPPISLTTAPPPALARTGHGADPTASSDGGSVISAAVAACRGSCSGAGSGSELDSALWSGSAELAAGSASGSARTVVPALGELLRTLIRLTPKTAPPPCPCPNGRR